MHLTRPAIFRALAASTISGLVVFQIATLDAALTGREAWMIAGNFMASFVLALYDPTRPIFPKRV